MFGLRDFSHGKTLIDKCNIDEEMNFTVSVAVLELERCASWGKKIRILRASPFVPELRSLGPKFSQRT